MKVIDFLNSMKVGSIEIRDTVNLKYYDDIEVYDRSLRVVKRGYKKLCNRKVSSIACINDTLILILED